MQARDDPRGQEHPYLATAMNHINLAKLATKLESLPKNYAAFTMSTFLEGTDGAAIQRYAEHNGGVHECGAVACAIGHGPAAGILFPAPDLAPELWEHCNPNWSQYSSRYLIDRGTHPAEWEWCFGGLWELVDDTHRGAAARIRYLLDGRKIPQVRDSRNKLVPFNSEYVKPSHRRLYAEFRKK